MKSSSVQRGKVWTLAACLLTAAMLLIVAGCRKEGGGSSTAGGGEGAASSSGAAGGVVPKQKDKYVVGFAQMENDGPWRIAETTSMKGEAAKRAGKFDLRVTDARGSTSQQVNDTEDLVSQGVDAIFLAPREATGFEGTLQAAREAKIPVILVDRETKGAAGTDFVTVLKSDFVEQGRRAGEWLAKQTNGKANIVELAGTSGASVTLDRGKGFRDAIAAHPDMKIIATQVGEFNRAKAQNVMQNIIQSMGKQITAVYAHNDEMALGAISALKGANIKPGTDVLIVSVDGQKSALQAILDGNMNATVESNPRFGPLAFDTLQRFFAGEKLPPVIKLEDRFFDKTNAAQFLNEAY